MSFNLLAAICLGYVTSLFLIAFIAERAAERGRLPILRSPLVYTLSISVYCTAWTYYGAVGSAARNGLEFVTIYLGPTLVFIGWWWLLRRIVRIGRAQKITSVADMISSRYGKSNLIAVLVTLLAVVGTTPYIALQLQSLSLSFGVLGSATGSATPPDGVTAFWIAAGLALFTVLFGTRNINANEQHHGVVTAVAVEAIIKLFALLAVGVFAVWMLLYASPDLMERVDFTALQQKSRFSGRWLMLVFLSAAAIICLPRMFQVIVVENVDEDHLRTAAWAFPAYLFLMSLFVLPIALAGLGLLPVGSNPDLFVLTLPLAAGQELLASLAFLGGFSAATSMVIVATIALSTMVSNHIVLPLWLRVGTGRNPESDDVRRILLLSRRLTIGFLMSLGYFYFRLSGGGEALASIGLVAFLGVSQVLPALLGGLFWQNATRQGAIAGLVTGFFVWAYTLLVPAFGADFPAIAAFTADGPLGIGFLRPQELFGLNLGDSLVHAVVWSIGLNTLAFTVVSLLSEARPIERVQGLSFIQAFGTSDASFAGIRRTIPVEELFVLAQRILGRSTAQNLFREVALSQGKSEGLPDATDTFVARLERDFSGAVGAATAHAMLAQITTGDAISVDALIEMADESAQIVEYSNRLERQSAELQDTARRLREANEKLTRLSAQKDAFLSQVSHELRTPMTSIRSFAEILQDTEGNDPKRTAHFAGIINTESQRLTRLLDEILDLSFLESGELQLDLRPTNLKAVLDQAARACEVHIAGNRCLLMRDSSAEHVELVTDHDRLAQVFINLIANAAKYCDAAAPVIRIEIKRSGTPRNGQGLRVSVIDNGTGIAAEKSELIFEKFHRETALEGLTPGVGLGLPISREIMRNLGGSLTYRRDERGTVFEVMMPLS